MQIKLNDLIESQESLGILLNQPLPIKTAYHLSKTVKKIQSEITQFHESRNQLIRKYGSEAIEGSGDFEIRKDDKDAVKMFEDDVKELLALEVEIPNYEPIPYSDIENSNISISPAHLANLIGTVLKE